MRALDIWQQDAADATSAFVTQYSVRHDSFDGEVAVFLVAAALRETRLIGPFLSDAPFEPGGYVSRMKQVGGVCPRIDTPMPRGRRLRQRTNYEPANRHSLPWGRPLARPGSTQEQAGALSSSSPAGLQVRATSTRQLSIVLFNCNRSAVL